MRAGGYRRPSWALTAVSIGITLLALTARAVSHGQKVSQTAMAHATATATGSGYGLNEDFLGFQAVAAFLASERADVWLCSIMGSVVVGLSGIFPLLVIPTEASAALRTEDGCQKLKQLLSFAIGGLLGDVFLHLLPEAWVLSGGSGHQQYMTQGLWVIAGLLSFLVLEKMFPDQEDCKDPAHTKHSSSHTTSSASVFSSESVLSLKNGNHTESWAAAKPKSILQEVPEKIKTSGYLNLLANCIDNFTHGLAVAGSFLVSKKVGFLTTFAILLHEIPHEVGDFAILLRAGFDRWNAARLQLSTALVGVLGAAFALCAQSPKGAENATAWILPFTSGGFLYIALVNVVPDLLEETSLRNSLLQILFIGCGMAVMAVLSIIVD